MVYGRNLGPEEAMLRVCHAIRYFGSRRYGQDVGMSVEVDMTSLQFASLTAFRRIDERCISWFLIQTEFVQATSFRKNIPIT